MHLQTVDHARHTKEGSESGSLRVGRDSAARLGNGADRFYLAVTIKRGAKIKMVASPYRIERDRGTRESQQQFAVLREKWPLAFPARRQDTRPLAIGATREIAAAMG